MESGQRWSESLIKAFTGGDNIRARKMGRDFFEFPPSHTLFVASNNQPRVRGTDDGIWRRFVVIPFASSFTGDRCDPYLPEKLDAESAAILAWAVRGCLQWQESGLDAPDVVRASNAAYRAEQDHVGQFIADRLVVDDSASITAADLRQIYEKWCEEQGEKPWSARAIGGELGKRGCEREKVGRTRVSTWHGIGASSDV